MMINDPRSTLFEAHVFESAVLLYRTYLVYLLHGLNEADVVKGKNKQTKNRVEPVAVHLLAS